MTPYKLGQLEFYISNPLILINLMRRKFKVVCILNLLRKYEKELYFTHEIWPFNPLSHADLKHLGGATRKLFDLIIKILFRQNCNGLMKSDSEIEI